MLRNRTHFLSLLLLICSAAVLAACIPTSSVAPSPASSTPLAPTPTAPVPTATTSSPAGGLKSFVDTAAAVLELITGFIVLCLAIYLIYRLNLEAQKYRFELADLKNGTGTAELDTALSGLQIIAREKLIEQLEVFQKDTKNYKRLLTEGTEFPDALPLPEAERATKSLDDVISALGEEAPKSVKPIVSLIHYFLPQQGTRINTILQHDGNKPGKVGVSFEIVDLSGEKNPVLVTLWQDDAAEKKIMSWVLEKPRNKKTDDTKEREVKQGHLQPAPAQEAWSTQVAKHLQKAFLEEDAISYCQMSLLQKPPDSAAADALVECQIRLQERALAATAFSMAATLEERGLLDMAIENYSSIFRHKEDCDRASDYWTTALKQGDGSKADAYYHLAEEYFNKLGLHHEAIKLYERATQQGSRDAIDFLQHYHEERAEHLVAASALLFENSQWNAAHQYLNEVLTALPTHKKAKELLAQLKERQPVEEDKETLAAFELGKVYQQQEDFARAKAQYELALQKKPEYAEAQAALTEVLQSESSLRSQFEQFLKSALVWLAVEIYRAESTRRLPFGRNKDLTLAQYHRFFGSHFLSYDSSYPYFFNTAEQEFLKAKELCPDWFVPYKNLGDAYTGKALRIREARFAFRNLERAASYYELALKKKELKKKWRLSLCEMERATEVRIKLDLAYANLLRWTESDESLRLVIEDAEKLLQPDTNNSNVLLESEHEQVYSSLASLYALVAYRFQEARNACGYSKPTEAAYWACFFVGCAGFINRERINEVASDLLLSRVFPDKEIRQDFATLIKTRQIQKEALKDKEKFTWQDVKSTLSAVGIKHPSDLPKEKE